MNAHINCIIFFNPGTWQIINYMMAVPKHDGLVWFPARSLDSFEFEF